MEACSVKAGINYLGQALHPNAVALPAPHGVSVARRSAGVPPQEMISQLEVSGGQAVMLSAIAWCPAAPELLALAIDLKRTVQLWRLQGELLSGSKIGERPLPAAGVAPGEAAARGRHAGQRELAAACAARPVGAQDLDVAQRLGRALLRVG